MTAENRVYDRGFSDSLANWLAGGDATNSINPKLNHGDYLAQQLQSQYATAGQNPLNFGRANAIDQQQSGLAQQLQGVSTGQQAGAGELAVNRQMGQATAAQQAQARMARGSNSALAARTAARNTADLGVAGAGQAQMAALNDQTAARGQLAGVLGQQQQGAYQQQGLTQQQYVAQNQAQLGYLGQLLGLDQAQMQAMLAKANMGLQDQGHGAALMQQAGTAIAASDKKLKTDIKAAGDAADELMSKLRPVSYRYKDEQKYGEGKRLGILAQHLEESKLGKSVVADLPDGAGKGFDIGKGLSAALAGVARLHERLSVVEGKG